MRNNNVISLNDLVSNSQLYRPIDDQGRIEAFIKPLGSENHGSNMMEMPNGDLVCVWFGGDKEGANNVNIVMSRLTPTADRWSEPETISDDPLRADQNPLLFVTPSGEVWLLYASQRSQGHGDPEWEKKIASGEMTGIHWMQWTSVIRRRISKDNGVTWSETTDLFPTEGSFCRNRMIILSNGDWLLPMYYSKKGGEGLYGSDTSAVQISSDNGATWTEVEIPNSKGRVHPTVVQAVDGELICLMRSRSADRIYISRSKDLGRHWTNAERTELPNNNASIQARTLLSGVIALVYNNISLSDKSEGAIWSHKRYPLTIALSEDNGKTWPIMRHIDTGDGFAGEANKDLNRDLAYPCVYQTPDGQIHVSYSFKGRECIKYVAFDEGWIRSGRTKIFG